MHLYKTMYKRNYKKMHKQKWLKSNVHWVNWVPRMTLIWWQLGWASKGTWQPSYENRGHPWVRRHCEGIWAICSRLVRRKKVCRVSFEFWAKCRTEVWEFMKHSRSEATVGKRARMGIKGESEYKCRQSWVRTWGPTPGGTGDRTPTEEPGKPASWTGCGQKTPELREKRKLETNEWHQI